MNKKETIKSILEDKVAISDKIYRCESCQIDLEDVGFDVPISVILNWDDSTLSQVEGFTFNILYDKGDYQVPSILIGYEYKRILDEYIELLEQEVEWCGSNEAKQVDMPQDYKDGFLAGINQAILFAKKLKEVKRKQ